MAELKNIAKKDWAKLLYVHEKLTQKEIAAKVGITEATLSKWVNTLKWDDMRTSVSVSKHEELKRIYIQMKSLNDVIAAREQKYADTKEADILVKLSSAAKSLETETSMKDVIDVFREFNEYVRAIDFTKAQDLVQLQDSYIKAKLTTK